MQQMMRARRLELRNNGSGTSRADTPATAQGPSESGTVPKWGADEGCSLLLTDAEHDFLETRFRDLTRREREVIFALCTGGTNEGMAERLCIALPTLRTHLMRLNQKLGTSSKGDVVRLVAMHLLDAYRMKRIQPASTPETTHAPETGVGA